MTETLSQPIGEDERLQALQTYPFARPDLPKLLDQLALVAAKLCETPVGLVSIVGKDNQHFLGKYGVSETGTECEVSFCAHAMHHHEIFVVPDATGDKRFADNPLVTGTMNVRFYAGVPLVTREGHPLGSLCVIDREPREGLTSSQREGLSGIAQTVMALIEGARDEANSAAEAEANRIALRERDLQYQLMADSTPQLLWSTDPDGMSDYFNRGWLEYTGQAVECSYGEGWMDFLHPDDHERTDACWRMAVKTRETYEIEYRLRNADGEYRWMLARGVPMIDEHGAVTRWFGSCTDIHDAKRSSEQLEILSRELSHRIKNIFAVIGGLVSLTIRHRPQFAEAGRELLERIVALGRAHDHVRIDDTYSKTEPARSSLAAMIELILAPYQGAAGERIRISGSDITIDNRSVTPLALFIHELGTNAAKYGALSTEAGRVEIDLADGEECVICWTERDGPPVERSSHEGFGANLVEMSVVRQLGGAVDYDWQPGGLVVTAKIPASALPH